MSIEHAEGPAKIAPAQKSDVLAMTTAPQDQPTPATIARRISGLLAGLERAMRQPNRRESYYIRAALATLEAKRLGEADEAVTKAERKAPLPADVASLVQTNEIATVEQLRAALGQVQVPR